MKKKVIKNKPSKSLNKKKASNKYGKIINLDLYIMPKASKEEWERYEAVLLTFGNFLFQNKIGTWGGRETAIGSENHYFARTNYWFVIESGVDKSVKELNRIVKNFRLGKVTKVKVGILIESKTDYKNRISKEKTFTWQYYRH